MRTAFYVSPLNAIFVAILQYYSSQMRYVKAITRIILIISVLIIIIWAIVSVPKHQCESITVAPHTQNESLVLGQAEVERMLSADSIAILGMPMKDIDVAAITRLLSANPYVEKVNFIHFSGSRLVVDYTLKHIILHAFSQDGDQYFVDDSGCLLPYTAKMQDDLPVANGHILQHYKQGDTARGRLAEMVNIVNAIQKDEFCQAQFQQLYLNEYNQIELVPAVGSHVVLFGDDQNIEEKLENLKLVYQEGLTRKGFDTYAQLDVRYKNRIIAKRK